LSTSTIATGWRTPPEVARELRVEPAKIIAWIRSGELAACNITQHVGGRARWRISRVALESFLASRANVKPPTPQPESAKRHRAATYKRKYY